MCDIFAFPLCLDSSKKRQKQNKVHSLVYIVVSILPSTGKDQVDCSYVRVTTISHCRSKSNKHTTTEKYNLCQTIEKPIEFNQLSFGLPTFVLRHRRSRRLQHLYNTYKVYCLLNVQRHTILEYVIQFCAARIRR